MFQQRGIAGLSALAFVAAIGTLVGCGGAGVSTGLKENTAAPAPAGQASPQGETTAATDASYANRQRFGMNLAGVIDYTSQLPFTDVFKTARAWKKTDEELNAIPLDPQGYPLLKPGQFLDYYMLTINGGKYPEGVYVATYEGKGKVEFRRSDAAKVVKEAPGRIEVKVAPGSESLVLTIHESDPKDPIRNVHVWMPGQEKAKSAFNPLFVERLRPFGALRFMDFQSTNNSPLVSWSERAKPADARYSTAKGVPVEVMVDLANTLKTNPWFCMPHKADDEFVRSFAKLIKERLDPKLKVYVEYSNEVWNGQFEQARYALAKGKARNLGPSDFESQLRFYSQRSVEVFKIWEQVFGDTKRLVRVMGAQSANPWTSEQVLTFQDAYKHTDALAIAPYFGGGFGSPDQQETVAKMTPEHLLDALDKEIEGQNRVWIEGTAKVAKKHKVQLVAYEGGQHLVGVGGAENNEKLAQLFFAANRHPRMYDLYRKHLKHWSDAGGGLYAVFSNVSQPSKWGSWGTLEYQDQPIAEAHKYRAVVDAIKGAKVAAAAPAPAEGGGK